MAGVGVLRTIEGGSLGFWCPGCEEMHVVRVRVGSESPAWTWNGSYDRPTFGPSILVRSGHHAGHWKPGEGCWCTYDAEESAAGRPVSGFKCSVCHSFVEDGRIRFLGDCSHALAGQTVELKAVE